MASPGELVGHIAEIMRFPVKSMRGERLERAELRWTGIAGDRQYAFVRSENRSRFPWLTGRDVSEMVLFDARYAAPQDPRNSALTVTAPDGQSYGIWDPALAERLEAAAGEPVHPLQLGRGAFDQHPISVISTAAHSRLSDAFGGAVDPHRFRINFVIEAAPAALEDERWRGRILQLGEAETSCGLRVDASISRCVMVTIDPETGRRDPAVMRMVAQDFGNQVGLYATPVACGQVAIGDPVYLR